MASPSLAFPPTSFACTWTAFLALASMIEVHGRRERERAPWREEAGYETWLPPCYHLATRVQRLDASHAFLDLGHCTADEAHAAAQTLLRRLARRGVTARIGLGPSLTLAQVALFRRPMASADLHGSVRLLAPDVVPAVLRAVPVWWLPALHPRGMVTADIVARLERYGLRTLAHLSRMDPQALRRQFGSAVGETLAAFASGADPLPFVPTSPPRALAVRLRFAEAVAPERVAAVIPHLAHRVASQLDGLQVTRAIALGLRWEQRGWASASTLLRVPVSTEQEVVRECTRLLAILLAGQNTTNGDDAVERLSCRLSGIASQPPKQETFWRTRAQQRAAADQVAQVLTRRYGPGIVNYLLPEAPDAIFPEERHVQHPVAPGESVAANSPRPAPTSLPLGASGDVWTAVPHRLHWW